MSRAALDTDFNNASRYIDMKLELYFNGVDQAPLTVYKHDYLIDADWLEEGAADSSNPFGNVSSNELSFRLYNEDGMFSPTNAAGPFYGKIKSGVLIIPFIKPIVDDTDIDWLKLGKYYVTGWDAQITGTYADVIANDKMYDIFTASVPNYPISLNKSYHDFLVEFFALLQCDAVIDTALSKVLPYAFVDGSVKEFLQSIVTASLSYATTNKDGVPTIGSLTASKSTRAVLTDGNQIKVVTSKQSITRAYDGVDLVYNVPQVSEASKIVDLSGIMLQYGVNDIANVSFSAYPLWQISSINIKAPTNNVEVAGYTATQRLISLLLNCKIASIAADLQVYGKIVKLTEVRIADSESKLLYVNSKYIQNASYATYYKGILNKLVDSTIPVVTLSVRGNPLLNIGDKVSVVSAKYNLSYTGIISRLKYTYNGALSCEMTLLNADILQAVS